MEKDLCLTIPTQAELVVAGNLFLYKKPPNPQRGSCWSSKIFDSKIIKSYLPLIGVPPSGVRGLI
jgi:hypothetical protein